MKPTKAVNPFDLLLEELDAAKGNKQETEKLIDTANVLASTWTDAEFLRYSEELVDFINKAREQLKG